MRRCKTRVDYVLYNNTLLYAKTMQVHPVIEYCALEMKVTWIRLNDKRTSF